MVSRNDFKFTLFADDSLSDAMSAYKDLGRRKGQRYQAMLVFIAAGFTSHFLFIFLFYFLGAGALSWLNPDCPLANFYKFEAIPERFL